MLVQMAEPTKLRFRSRVNKHSLSNKKWHLSGAIFYSSVETISDKTLFRAWRLTAIGSHFFTVMIKMLEA
jgi:hypothetical protein